MFHGRLDYFQEPFLGGKLDTKPGDHGSPKSHNHGFIVFYHVWGPAWIENSLKQHLVEDIVINDFTLHLRICAHTAWFWRCVGTAFGHFLLGSQNFRVTALGSCVKWPLVAWGNTQLTYHIRVVPASDSWHLRKYIHRGCMYSNEIKSNKYSIRLRVDLFQFKIT